MEPIAVQPYYKVEREVTGLEQRMVMHERSLRLYRDKITTQYREFPLGDVYDISYRGMGGEDGILYLHTKQGVYSYNINQDPAAFILAFKEGVQLSSDE